MSKTTINNNGIGVLGGMTLLFTAAKLFGYVDWSWWTVLAPTWVPMAIGLGILAVGGAVLIAAKLFDK